MRNLFVCILYILMTVEFFLGNFANIFIALVNFIDWVKRQKLSSADRILTALTISRIALLWVTFMFLYSSMLNTTSYNVQVRIIFNITGVVCNHFSTWFATLLSIFYLLKIANFHNFIFLHLKKNINLVISVVLLGSSVFLFYYLAVMSVEEIMWVNECERNVTQKTNLTGILHLSNMAVLTMLNLTPFTTSLLCFLLLICSQSKHVRKMQLHGKGPQDLSTKAHIRALQLIFSFLLLFSIYTVSIIASVWRFNELQNKPLLFLWQVCALIYPSSHSFLLIWGNKKLTQTFLSMLRQVKRKWNPLTL
uniref:Taste receptor type 2 n=1 Tax=Oryctolagus cuniculus TaxID=9986 RepID=A0A5F9DE51_RABIT|nr:putative taste receptor type 2 member 33 [Oryctolagus cuniculus]